MSAVASEDVRMDERDMFNVVCVVFVWLCLVVKLGVGSGAVRLQVLMQNQL